MASKIKSPYLQSPSHGKSSQQQTLFPNSHSLSNRLHSLFSVQKKTKKNQPHYNNHSLNMKVTAAAAIMGLAALVGAANTERHQARDLDTTLRVMNNVLDQMVVVDNVISAFWDTSDLPAVQEAGTKMIAIIRASDEDILAMTPVPLQDAIAFQPLSDKLNAQGDKLLEGVEAKVPLFGRAAVCPTMHTAVSTIGTFSLPPPFFFWFKHIPLIRK